MTRRKAPPKKGSRVERKCVNNKYAARYSMMNTVIANIGKNGLTSRSA